jgi:hypothetical protein
MALRSRPRWRTPLAVLATAAALIVAWLVWSALGTRSRAGAAEPAVAPAPAASRAAAPPGPADLPLAHADTPTPTAPVSAPPSDGDDPERTAIDTDDPTAIEIELVVREKGSAAPIAQAEVLYFEGASSREAERLVMQRGLDHDALRRVAKRGRTDDSGRARVRCHSGQLFLIASSPSHWGAAVFDIKPDIAEPFVVELEPMSYVLAQVVDTAGRPRPGVRVVLSRKVSGLFDFGASGSTAGPDAIARLGPVDTRTEERELWLARIDGALPSSASVEFDVRAIPAEPLRLVLPEHGALDVRLVQKDGATYAGPARVTLTWMADEEESAHPLEEEVRLGSGRASFELVGLDFGVRAVARVPGVSGEFEVTGWGPRKAGERAELTIQFVGHEYAVVVGKALDTAGAPIANADLEIQGFVGRGSGIGVDAEVQLDAAGGFAFAARLHESALAVLCLRCDRMALGAVVRPEIALGRTDLGRVVLTPARLVASGTVVDADGAPVAEADVRFEAGESLLDTAYGSCAEVKSGPQGQFQLRGWSDGGMVRLRGFQRGRRIEGKVEVALGSQNVRLVLSPIANGR